MYMLKKDTWLDNTHDNETVTLCKETWSGVQPVLPVAPSSS